MDKAWKVYCYTNVVTGQQYVGNTCKPLSYRSGKNGASYTREPNPFGDAIKQYGWENFVSEVIEVTETRQEAFEKEQYYIEHLHTQVPDGYNRSSGGYGATGISNPCHSHWSDHEYPSEAKKKISESIKRIWTTRARQVSDETSRKFSLRNTGRKWWTNGVDNKFTYECPGEGWTNGMSTRR